MSLHPSNTRGATVSKYSCRNGESVRQSSPAKFTVGGRVKAKREPIPVGAVPGIPVPPPDFVDDPALAEGVGGFAEAPRPWLVGDAAFPDEADEVGCPVFELGWLELVAGAAVAEGFPDELFDVSDVVEGDGPVE